MFGQLCPPGSAPLILIYLLLWLSFAVGAGSGYDEEPRGRPVLARELQYFDRIKQRYIFARLAWMSSWWCKHSRHGLGRRLGPLHQKILVPEQPCYDTVGDMAGTAKPHACHEFMTQVGARLGLPKTYLA